MSRGTRIGLVGGCYGLTGFHIVLLNLHFLLALKNILKQFISKEHRRYFHFKTQDKPFKGTSRFLAKKNI